MNIPAGATTGRDYSLVGPERARSIARGLADAQWYTSPVPRDQMRAFMVRRNGPAVRDTLLWFALLAGSGYVAHRTFGTWWMIPAFFVYATLYGSVSDSRWHECAHRTAFKSTWMNDAVYYLASFMVWREAVSWRWSHVRHHSDTIIVGRDPEIANPRPMRLRVPLKECLGLSSNPGETRKIMSNVAGRLTPAELDYIPESERPKAILTARVYVLLWALTVALAVVTRSVEPLLFVIGPSFYGKWLMVAYGVTQHAGLAEDTLDHRLNSRTVRMNRLHRYLYWNMNFHIEHHMFPTVPFHALPALHEAVKDDLPPVYSGFRVTYREILDASRAQAKDPSFFVDRTALLPAPKPNATAVVASLGSIIADGHTPDGWVVVGPVGALAISDAIGFDIGDRTYAVYRLADGSVHATDGLCTHGAFRLCEGHVDGGVIECPKHNGRFEIATGKAVGRPAKVDLNVHEARERDGRIELRIGPDCPS